MEKTIKLLNDIKSECNQNILYYQDNRTISIQHSINYISGKIDGSSWLCKLIEDLLNLEVLVAIEFINKITSKKEKLANLNICEYSMGLYDQLDEIQRKVNDRINTI
jgi:hypothetical protein